ncbi:MAG: TlpA family protein disulfide reductase [Betaproteobacteria bacterium]|nr:TlpA family protein disulfide reductase [Betaproteobacteria bacterium]MDH4292461.1 TlpA family protein disulfide reductase [Betaproteobacteria bacterium]MDH5341430.1 TlpA family protein disulfide reductase [Betaproteobacteria bacterium]
MSPVRRALLFAGAGGLAAAAGYAAHLWRLGSLGSSGTADAAAAILNSRLTALDGTVQSLAAFRGKVLVINYWATWCAPCREEIPLFIRLQGEFADKNLQFVGIAIDQVDKVRDFAKEFQINYPVLLAGIEAMELSRQAGNKAGVLPYTLVLDRSGAIAVRLVGAISEARMRKELAPLL